MAARPTWKGYLKISLVNIPIKVFLATDAAAPDEVKLARQVIGTFEGELDFASYHDDYQKGLRDIIDAKIEGREIVSPEVEAPPKVVNLMEALRKSLDTVSASKKRAPVAPFRQVGRAVLKKPARA